MGLKAQNKSTQNIKRLLINISMKCKLITSKLNIRTERPVEELWQFILVCQGEGIKTIYFQFVLL